jgi:hypothetical protein
MNSLDHNVADRHDAEQIVWMFARTYRLEHGRFVNKVGREAPQVSVDLAARAQAVLAGLS